MDFAGQRASLYLAHKCGAMRGLLTMTMSTIINKSLTEADVFLDSGEVLKGNIYLSQDETADDVINNGNPFLILKVDDATRMVNKNVVAKISVSRNQINTQNIHLVPHEKVQLSLRNGDLAEGVVLLKGFNRVSSEINSGATFTAFFSDEKGVVYFRSDTIAQVFLETKETASKSTGDISASRQELRALI
jgi:hypothetical protein